MGFLNLKFPFGVSFIQIIVGLMNVGDKCQRTQTWYTGTLKVAGVFIHSHYLKFQELSCFLGQEATLDLAPTVIKLVMNQR